MCVYVRVCLYIVTFSTGYKIFVCQGERKFIYKVPATFPIDGVIAREITHFDYRSRAQYSRYVWHFQDKLRETRSVWRGLLSELLNLAAGRYESESLVDRGESAEFFVAVVCVRSCVIRAFYSQEKSVRNVIAR